MDPQEIRDKIMAAINGIIKDDSEESSASLHDVLAAKMRDRINPEGDAPETPDVDLDPENPEDPDEEPETPAGEE